MESRARIQNLVGNASTFQDTMSLHIPSGFIKKVPDVIRVERQVGAELGSLEGRGMRREGNSLSREGYVVCEGYFKGGLAFNRLGGVAFLQREQQKQRHRDRIAWDAAGK